MKITRESRDSALKAITYMEGASDLVGMADRHCQDQAIASSLRGIQVMLSTMKFEIQDAFGIPDDKPEIGSLKL